MGFPIPGVKNSPAKTGDVKDAGLIPGLRRFPGGGHGNPLQCSCLANPMAEWPVGLQSMCAKVQSCLTLSNRIDCRPQDSSVHEIL